MTRRGIRIETIEFSLTEGKVIQSRGLCNTNTPHHDRIVRLVNAHALRYSQPNRQRKFLIYVPLRLPP